MSYVSPDTYTQVYISVPEHVSEYSSVQASDSVWPSSLFPQAWARVRVFTAHTIEFPLFYPFECHKNTKVPIVINIRDIQYQQKQDWDSQHLDN